jgi:predicted nucleic acid-binding protein
VQRLPEGTTLLPVQTLGELFILLVRKARRPPAKACKAILSWQDAFPLIETSAQVMLAAADLATDHQLSIWDSVILSAAAESGCRLLLSEDMQEGFTSFAPSKHELLTALLDARPWDRRIPAISRFVHSADKFSFSCGTDEFAELRAFVDPLIAVGLKKLLGSLESPRMSIRYREFWFPASERKDMSQVISFINMKGGAGNTKDRLAGGRSFR